MKNSQGQKLLTYSALSASFLLLNGTAKGQIIYNDFDPDIVMNTWVVNTYEETFIDIDLDGVKDFRIWASNTSTSWGSAGGRFMGIQPLGSNEVAETIVQDFCGSTGSSGSTSFTFNRDMAKAFYGGSAISSALSFTPVNRPFVIDTWFSGYGYCSPAFFAFPNGTQAYLGIRIKIDSDWHYGWIRIKRDLLTLLTIYDYALSAVPDQPLVIDGTGLTNCDPPSGLNVNFLSPSMAELSWTPVPDGLKYFVSGTKIGTGANYSKATSNTFVAANSLSSGTYEWRVRAKCIGEILSAPSAINTFTVPEPFETDEGSKHTLTSRIEFLNRTQLQLNLELDQEDQIQIELFNNTGALVADKTIAGSAGNHMVKLDFNEVPPGLYLIHIKGEQVTRSEKIIIM